MPPSIELSGTERITLEIEGRLPLAAAREHVRELTPIEFEGGVEASVLFFDMRGLKMSAPLSMGPAQDYQEALWRIGIDYRGARAWLAIACDLDSRMVRTLGGWLVRYPVRSSAIAIAEEGVRVSAGSAAFEARLLDTGRAAAESGFTVPNPIPPRPMLVFSASRLYRIPWREDAAPTRREVTLHIQDRGMGERTFGACVDWAARGLSHRGRVHHCGIAQRVRSS